MLGPFQPRIDSSLGHMAPKTQRLRNCLLTQSFLLHISTSTCPSPDNREYCHLRVSRPLRDSESEYSSQYTQ